MTYEDRDPGDEASPSPAPATTTRELFEEYALIVRDACTVCGRIRTWHPFGVATLRQWVEHLAAQLPYVCQDCRDNI
jgi:hypothetical protein